MGKKGRTEKVSVTLPRELVGEIRAIIPQGGVSSFFTEAVQQYLSYHRQRTAMEKSFGAWKSDKHPELATPKDSTAYVRTLREMDGARLSRLRGSRGK